MAARIEHIRSDQRGFTLIELLVVVLIIGILAAIAIPAFLGQREKSQDAAAKAAVRQAHTAAEAYRTDTDSYTGMTKSALEGIETSLRDAQGFTVTGVTSTGYTVTVQSAAAGRTFSIAKTAGSTLRSCTPAGGGCRTTTAGVDGW